jgi:SAM-dependent methyltransferase
MRTQRVSGNMYSPNGLVKRFAMSMKHHDFYSMRTTVQVSVNLSGWRHPGEAIALGVAAPLVRSKRVLDLGVGGGRTVALLSLLTDQYIGVDYSPEMVAACRARYPGKEFRVVDARDMSVFEDGSFEFVFFSYNGIDTVGEQDRTKIYHEVHRVLSEEGLFAFSTLNKDGRSYKESPFQLHRPGQPFDRSLRAAARLIFLNARDPHRLGRRYRNWRLAKRERVEGDGWAMCALAHRDFILMNHFVTLERLRAELAEAGFSVIAILGSDSSGGELLPTAITKHSDSFYAVVRKRLPA